MNRFVDIVVVLLTSVNVNFVSISYYFLKLLFESAPSIGHAWSGEFASNLPAMCGMMDNMAFRCHWILRRLEDVLPGPGYRWPGAEALVDEMRAAADNSSLLSTLHVCAHVICCFD
jgi:hypothetical protein